jgi:hypothetical protein
VPLAAVGNQRRLALVLSVLREALRARMLLLPGASGGERRGARSMSAPRQQGGTGRTKSVVWVRTEAEARALMELGWAIADQNMSHHHFHAVLMEWRGDGEARLKE